MIRFEFLVVKSIKSNAMIKMLCVILPVFLLSSTLYGQKCKNVKDEIDPFTNKKIIISRGFSLSGIDIMNTQPYPSV